jgi:peroxiredoxin
VTLARQLHAIMAEQPDDYQRLVADLAERLRQSACERVLHTGEAMPAFVLPNAEGDLVFSGDLLARGSLVLYFFRGGWCPFCRTTLAALEGVRAEIEAAGGTLVALSPDTAGYNTAMKRALQLGFDVLSDVGSAVALQFGIVYRVPEAYLRALAENEIDLVRRHGDDWSLLPMPATFVVSRAGLICYAHASGDVTDRTDPETIAEKVRALCDDTTSG